MADEPDSTRAPAADHRTDGDRTGIRRPASSQESGATEPKGDRVDRSKEYAPRSNGRKFPRSAEAPCHRCGRGGDRGGRERCRALDCGICAVAKRHCSTKCATREPAIKYRHDSIRSRAALRHGRPETELAERVAAAEARRNRSAIRLPPSIAASTMSPRRRKARRHEPKLPPPRPRRKDAAQTGIQRGELDALWAVSQRLRRAVKTCHDDMARQTRARTTASRGCGRRRGASRRARTRRPLSGRTRGGKSLGAGQDAIAPLEPFAATGVPSAAALAHELSAITPSLRQRSGVTRRRRHFLGSLRITRKNWSVSRRSTRRRATNLRRSRADQCDAARVDITGALADIDACRIVRSLAESLDQESRLRATAPSRRAGASLRTRSPRSIGRTRNDPRSLLSDRGRALAYGVALLSDRPGDVVITWQGLRIETSLMVGSRR